MTTPIPNDSMSAFEAVTWCFEQAAQRMNVDEEHRDLMRSPWRELTVELPIRLDNGKLRVLQAIGYSTTRPEEGLSSYQIS